MKINQTIGLLLIGLVLIGTTDYAQTTPVGTATPTTYPIGAVATDSMPSKGSSDTRKKPQSQRTTGAVTTNSVPDANYRQSSTSDGTSINNSNTTNYNSNNVTNAPTGAGSNPSSTGSVPASSSGTREKNPSGSSNGSPTGNPANTSAGGAAAVKGARTTEVPAVQSGSTNRNTSIHDFIASSPNYTTLQNALQSTGLDDNLKGGKTYTVFAPSNSAFKKLPTAMQVGLLEGRNREALTKLLNYHVVSGSINAVELSRQLKTGNGKSQLQTLTGGTLTVQLESDGHLTLIDEQGNTARVDTADNRQVNGVVYGIDTVLMPKSGTVNFH